MVIHMEEFFSVDGPVYGFFNKLGGIIAASAMWLIGCIPIITIGTSTTALYYATVKSVRKETGYIAKEFWRSYKMNLKKGSLSTFIMLAFSLVYGLELYLLHHNQLQVTAIWELASKLLLLFLVLIFAYLFPVMSRFDMPLSKMWILAFVMSIRYFYITIILLVGLVAVVYAQIFILPIPMVLITPGLWCYLSSFLVEKALRGYMPKCEEEAAEQWYYR